MPKESSKRGIEDILFEKNLLSPDQLSAIKFENVNTGKGVEAILREREFVNESDLVRAKGEYYRIPYIGLVDLDIPPDVLDNIPESIAKKHVLIPFKKEGNKLLVAMSDPLDLEVIEFLEKSTGVKVEPHIAEVTNINSAVETQYEKSIGAEVSAALEEVSGTATKIREQIKDIEKAEETLRDAPVARIVSALLEYAVKSKASDVHIEPGDNKTRVRYRIDGILQERFPLPKNVHDSVIARIKILSNMKIDEKRVPQDGRFKIEVGRTKTDLRVSTIPTVLGEKIVIRLLKEEGTILGFKDLGMRGTGLKRFEEALLKPHGIILVTGPTSSGKTVTLAAALSKLNTVRVNIITLEDPVEIRIAGVNHIQINTAAGLTFASGLRSILRQDPNIIMVGEIRDEETAELGVHAALTGHLVLSTLHTNNAASAIPRLLDMKVENFLLASTLVLVVAQRLVRMTCQDCIESYEAPAEMAEDIMKTLGSLYPGSSKAKTSKSKKNSIILKRGKGCKKCGDTGYIGRTGIFEVMPISDRIASMTLERRASAEVEKVAIEEGMISLIQDGFLKVLDGITTMEEVLRVARE